MKVVINRCYGGFSLSVEAMELYAKKISKAVYPEQVNAYFTQYWLVPEEERVKPINWNKASIKQKTEYNRKIEEQMINNRNFERHDPILVEVVEELGEKASGQFADLEIIEIPDDVEYTIQEYDGVEWVAEKHRTWGD
jgi:hypothetical protein